MNNNNNKKQSTEKKIGWLYGARWMQKTASLRSRQVIKTFASAGTGRKSIYGLGLWGAK
jgi:hypothetical protein